MNIGGRRNPLELTWNVGGSQIGIGMCADETPIVVRDGFQSKIGINLSTRKKKLVALICLSSLQTLNNN